MMEKINPKFKQLEIDEITGGLPPQAGVTPQATTTPQASPNAQPVQSPAVTPQQPVNAPSDVRTVARMAQSATALQGANKRINTATEFPQAFKDWFASLGYKADNPAISIMKVMTEVKKAMTEMGFK